MQEVTQLVNLSGDLTCHLQWITSVIRVEYLREMPWALILCSYFFGDDQASALGFDGTFVTLICVSFCSTSLTLSMTLREYWPASSLKNAGRRYSPPLIEEIPSQQNLGQDIQRGYSGLLNSGRIGGPTTSP